MNSSRRPVALRFPNLGLAMMLCLLSTLTARQVAAQTVPSDASPTCTVSASTFATWFQSGTPAVNGVVNPANSVAFPNTPNCSFYQWSKQMFLWLTSPAPSIYGGGGRIMDSATFFDVSPPDSSGQRTFLPHRPNFIRILGVRAAQVGPNGLPVVVSKSGRLLEVEQAVNGGALRVRAASGTLSEVAHARREHGVVVIVDRAGVVIKPPPHPIIPTRAHLPNVVQQIIVDRIPIFVDPFGNVVEVEQGQADSSVLAAQSGSLIYYAILVNDVYAYFLTGVKDGAISSSTFPTTMADLNAVTSFGAMHGASFVDPDALAVEIKTSWVEASSLADPSKYVTITASIPTYNTSSGTTWTPTGQKTTTLAMVGMHVVGSTAGHPEMIWATFEHLGNTPNAEYHYINTFGTDVKVPQTTSGTWLFTKSGSSGPFNLAHMTQVGSQIDAVTGFTISPSDTLRLNPWGASETVSPNPIDGSPAASNTEIIAINNAIAAMLPSGDVRNNYIMTGATWTIGGAAPDSFNQVGTSQLANSTMETYQQGTNCFDCHTSSNPSIATTGVSHIFGDTKPLF